MQTDGDVSGEATIGNSGAAGHEPPAADPGVTATIAPQLSPEIPLEPVTRWKQFEIRERVGAGGFGEVFLAWDTQLHREVALKLLRRSDADDALYEEILHEARALARVRHQNVVPVYGVDREGVRIGFWSEFIRGRNLSQLLDKQGAFGEREAALIGMDVCRAMSAVHAAGLVHRDIKAANVIREDGGRILLMDFGLSHDAGRERHRGGTPGYMAPELARGEQPSVASDIFAAGVLLFHLVTRKYPAPGKTLLDHRADLSTDFVKVVETSMSTDAAGRFATAGQMLAALASISGATLALPSKRRWWIPAAVLGLLAAGAVPFILRTALSKSSPLGQERYLNATRLLTRVDQAGNIEKAIYELKALSAAEPSNALALAGLARAYWLKYQADGATEFLTLARQTSDRAMRLNQDLAPVHVTLGKILARTGNTELADQELQRALQLDRRSSDVWSAFGDLYRAQGRLQEAQDAIEKAIALSPDDWRYMNQLGAFKVAQGSFDEGIAAYKEAARLTPGNYLPWNNMGIALRSQRNLREAEATLRKAVQLAPLNRTYSNLANVLFDQERYSDAAAAYSKAIELNPAPYITWGNLGAALRLSGAPAQKVEAAYREAVRRAEQERQLVPKDASLLAILSTYRLYLRDAAAAKQLARQAVALDPESPVVLLRAAETFAGAGAPDEAIRHLRLALARGASQQEILRAPEFLDLQKSPAFQALFAKRRP